MSAIRFEKDPDGIVVLTMDMSGSTNTMNDEFVAALRGALNRLDGESGLTGVVLASAKKVFFAGGDLRALVNFDAAERPEFMSRLEGAKQLLRRLERLPVPVVAAINGAAMGGGFELCLACNHRIALDRKEVQVGLPEVSLGLLPGCGGVVRLVNLLGLERALPILLEGTRSTVAEALSIGIVDSSVDEPDDLIPSAKAWIRGERGNPDAALQPWDRKSFKLPGGDLGSSRVAQLIASAPAVLRKKTRGLLPAPEQILDCAIEAARLDFDTAMRVESRALTYLVGTAQARNMISTFFFAMKRAKSPGVPATTAEPTPIRKVGVIGAGMMGQGIAFVTAHAGIDVILKDVSVQAASKGRSYSERVMAKRVSRGNATEQESDRLLSHITPTGDLADLQNCDLIIEAVFENLQIKDGVLRESEKLLAPNGIWASNTSTLPITHLARSSSRPSHFIGLHFFSPVDKMPLVEIICGEHTSDETLLRAREFVRQIRMTPIVVNDSLGFFTSRTFSTYLDEGVRLLVEGIHPIRIDSLGRAVGMPTGPLAQYDEVSLKLGRSVRETWREMGVLDRFGDESISRGVVTTLVLEHGRGGRHHGGGFYEYAENGSKRIWPRLFDLYYKPASVIDDRDIKDRLLFRQVIECLKCLETGVLRSVDEGNIGSILGIGAPTWTGGLIQFVNGYGVQRFVDRCTELAARYGQRFNPPQIAVDKARAQALFA